MNPVQDNIRLCGFIIISDIIGVETLALINNIQENKLAESQAELESL